MTDDPLPYNLHPNGVAVLTFNRPHARNALNLATMRAFAEQVAQIAQDESVRVVILTGAGAAAFCSGGDLNDLSQHPTAEGGLAMVTLMGDALRALEALPIPVIAAINGYAIGGGSEIALACDLRVADERAQLGLVHIKRGLIPGWGGGQRLLRLVGYGTALDLLLTGRILEAPELLALGLISRIAPAGHALNTALDMAGHIAQSDAETVRAVKQLLRSGLSQPYDEALQTERSLFPARWVGDTHQQAMRKFLERRGKTE